MKLELTTILLALVLGGCAKSKCPETTPPATATAEPGSAEAGASTAAESDESATVVVFVRHAEKANDGTPDPPLTERGQRRADCLATLLEPFEPDRLLTSQYQRTQATLEPLARAARLTPVVIEASDAQAWSDALHELPPGSRVVVSGHSNTLPAWAGALGAGVGSLDDKGNIPDDEYDRMVQVIIDGQGRTVTSFVTAYCVEAPAPTDVDPAARGD